MHGLGVLRTADSYAPPESVADYLERPLYSISGGELGTEVSAVEEQLEKIFNLAKRWNAVTLLDEADVLLCKRSSAEMDRNAIVAGKHNQTHLSYHVYPEKHFGEAARASVP